MRMTLYTWDQTQETKEQNKDLFNVNVKAHLIWRAVLNNFSAQIAAFDCPNILEGNAGWLKKKNGIICFQYQYILIVISSTR